MRDRILFSKWELLVKINVLIYTLYVLYNNINVRQNGWL
jgi:hypothetical protein